MVRQNLLGPYINCIERVSELHACLCVCGTVECGGSVKAAGAREGGHP